MAEKSVEVVEGLVLRAPASGRRTYSKSAEQALVQMCMRPGISVAGTALAHGINANLLRRWMTQYGQGAKGRSEVNSGAALVPVSTAPAAARSSESSIELTYMGYASVALWMCEPSAQFLIVWPSERDRTAH